MAEAAVFLPLSMLILRCFLECVSMFHFVATDLFKVISYSFVAATEGLLCKTAVHRAISPDNRWVLTQPAHGGPLSLVPAGAGEMRQLTHDSISYARAAFMPDGQHLLSAGIEPGHGGRDYLIDVNTGESKAITPEGTTGTLVSPDGRKAIMRGPTGRIGVWSFDTNSAVSPGGSMQKFARKRIYPQRQKW